MPKISQIQTAFTGGEFSPMLYGQIHADRYKAGIQTCLNYIPTLQGPLVRRPGTKYVTNVKSSSQPPALIPFIFSQTQAYALEFGSSYIRFYTNNGQVVTNSNVFQVGGSFGIPGDKPYVTGDAVTISSLTFSATRLAYVPLSGESVVSSAVIAAGQPLELKSPYGGDTAQIKFAQQNDTLYLAHPNYPPYKLQRAGNYEWRISPVVFQDGPYLPFNSYSSVGDLTNVTLAPSGLAPNTTLSTGSSWLIYAAAAHTTGEIKLTLQNDHNLVSGQKIWVSGVLGTLEANNDYSSINSSVWTVTVPSGDTTHVILNGTKFVNTLFHSTGLVQPAVFLLNTVNSSSPFYGFSQDCETDRLRTVALIDPTSGARRWGVIAHVTDAAHADIRLIGSSVSTSGCTWQLGCYSVGNGFPRAVTFHQDRLGWAGAQNFPQQIDLSQAGSYEQYAAAGSNQQVSDKNALQFHLLSGEANPVMWMKSAAQGLLAGSLNAEWVIAPNTQAGGLTPTNVNATATSFFGSADVDAVVSGNASVYIQRAQRKVREMNYFFQVGTFRSTDLTEISEHISLPQITKLAVQKETLPLVWGVRSDGYLVSMSYSRDDVSLKAGWARHVLGGQSDSGGTNPVVKSICAIPATANSSAFEQLWMVVNRATLSGSSYCAIEYLTKPYDDGFLQEDAFFGDCGATYDSPVAIIGVTPGLPGTLITATGHGLSDGDQLRIVGVNGVNSSSVDAYGNRAVTNLVNEKTFWCMGQDTFFFRLLESNTGSIGSSASQSVAFNSAVSGSYFLTYNGVPSAAINYNDTAATIQTDLGKIPAFSGLVTVSGNFAGSSGNFALTFNPSLGNPSLLVVGSNTTAGSVVVGQGGFGYRPGFSPVLGTGYGAYINGGQLRRAVLTISGLDWLNGETVGCLTDGGNHPDVTVQSGAVTLNYRAAKVQFGYRYNSDGQSLQDDGGSAIGTAIGQTRRVHRAAFQLHNVGNFQVGSVFTDLQTLELTRADQQMADQATPLFSGIIREGVGGAYDFFGDVCWRQNDMLPGMIQSMTLFYEVQDV